ncbi:multicopper oxidase domain-containing protein [Thiolapillus sp.]
MRSKRIPRLAAIAALLVTQGVSKIYADVLVQCPGDADGDAIVDSAGSDVKCMHLGAGDGYATMADGTTSYIFGFSDLTGLPTNTQSEKENALQAGMVASEWPAPTIELQEGQEFYLTLTNIGMMIRPDLFDPHTVHFHGFPEAAYVFDGVPDASIAINMGSSLSYYYKLNDPGTYMYHCHVEATEHMQMGMLGNLYVKPLQNKLPDLTDLSGFTHHTGYQYVYNDGDGSTYYDVEYPIQIGSFDSDFHNANETVQPLPFADMQDNYPMLNGRGYPDTADPRTDDFPPTLGSGGGPGNPIVPTSQPVSSLVTANAGETVLLRISNLNITRFYTLQTLGVPMRVVGKDAKLLRGPTGLDLTYQTNSVYLGGGESYDVLLDIPADAAGEIYYLYTSNLNYLANDTEAFGGMMTEIRIN